MSIKAMTSFTLIELLVVVAIIAVLIAILLPALTKARELSRKAVCLSREQQHALAMTYYQANNNEYFAGGWSFGSYLSLF